MADDVAVEEEVPAVEDYTLVTNVKPTDNPAANGWYEIPEDDGSDTGPGAVAVYLPVLTQDTTPVSGKSYYVLTTSGASTEGGTQMPATYTLEWDKDGERKYENGVSNGVLYRKTSQTAGKEWVGVAWNGLTSVSETPEGADPTDLYADNRKYATLRSAETFGGTIEAYTYPPEFEYCNGERQPVKGMTVGQQSRESFRLCYRTNQGNDQDPEAGYKLHLIYGCTCSPSERTYETINDSPDAITFSWDYDSIPANMTGYKPVSSIVVNSLDYTTDKEKAALAALEAALYGDGTTEPYMPDPDAVKTLLTPAP